MKRFIVLCVGFAMIIFLNFADIQSATAAAKVKLTFTSVSVPDDAHTKAMYTFKEELEKLTNGEVEVEVFHSGQLFTQEGEQAAIRKGTLDMCYTSPQWLAEFVPYMSMFAAAYSFKNYEHMSKTYNGEIGKTVFDDVAKQIGIRPLGAFYLGTRQINLRDIGREVKTPADMKGVKLRMPNSPSWLFMGKALGANPTPLSFTEVYLALKTGTIDGQDNPLPTDKNAKFYEVTKYIILTDHSINPVFPTINEKKWQSLGPDLQGKVYQALEKARQVCDKLNLDAEAELVEFFKKEGLTIIVPDKKAFMDYAQKMYLDNKEMSGNWDMELFKKIQALAE
jgi:tripartite ATP-independent transporter DctP family solute receptor